MATKFISMRNLRFLLYEISDLASLPRHDYYHEYDREMLDMASELAERLLWPCFQEMDRNPPELADDTVKVHSAVKTMLKEFGTGGWIATTVPETLDGQQLPHLVVISQSKGPERFLADATLYLELFGIVSVAWQWLLQAVAVQKALERGLPTGEEKFYQGKFYAFRYFFGYELPKIEGLAKRLMNTDGLTVEMEESFFSD